MTTFLIQVLSSYFRRYSFIIELLRGTFGVHPCPIMTRAISSSHNQSMIGTEFDTQLWSLYAHPLLSSTKDLFMDNLLELA